MQLIIVCRFFPGGRTAVTLCCGIVGYERRRFVTATAVAGLIWAPRRGHPVCTPARFDRVMMRRLAVRAAVPVLVLAAVTSCATSTPAPAPGAASSAATSPSAAGKAAACDVGAWRSAPVSVTRPVARPAIVTGVRSAAHPECGYDRLVLDTTGPLQSYDIRYVGQVTADPSGKPITRGLTITAAVSS